MDELTTHTSNKDENDPFLPVSTYPLSSELPPPSPGLLLPPQSFIHDVVQAATPALEIEKGRLRSGTIRSYATCRGKVTRKKRPAKLADTVEAHLDVQPNAGPLMAVALNEPADEDRSVIAPVENHHNSCSPSGTTSTLAARCKGATDEGEQDDAGPSEAFDHCGMQGPGDLLGDKSRGSAEPAKLPPVTLPQQPSDRPMSEAAEQDQTCAPTDQSTEEMQVKMEDVHVVEVALAPIGLAIESASLSAIATAEPEPAISPDETHCATSAKRRQTSAIDGNAALLDSSNELSGDTGSRSPKRKRVKKQQNSHSQPAPEASPELTIELSRVQEPIDTEVPESVSPEPLASPPSPAIRASRATTPEQCTALVPEFPTQFNEPFTESMSKMLRRRIADVLVKSGVVAAEAQHARRSGCRQIPLELLVRVSCDGCMHAITFGSWLCKYCRRELCLECGDTFEQLRNVKLDDTTPIGMRLHVERVMACQEGRRHGKDALGKGDDFQACSRMTADELEGMDRAIGAAVLEHDMGRSGDGPLAIDRAMLTDGPLSSVTIDDQVVQSLYLKNEQFSHEFMTIPVDRFDLPPTKEANSVVNAEDAPWTSIDDVPAPIAPIQVDTSPLRELELKSTDLFRALWSKGEPIVMEMDLARQSRLDWTPDGVAEGFGKTAWCTMVSNGGLPEVRSRVGTFFKSFGKPRDIADSFRIKDWPSTNDFAAEFPERFRDFMSLLPIGCITRRDGVLNIAAHAPVNSNRPDLGPKGYFSHASSDEPGGVGSTKLHMDLADAVNVCLWAADLEGSPGHAVWDIYRAEDSALIREFLYERQAESLGKTVQEVKSNYDDPIHSQLYFLDSALRAELYEKKGVKSWRIHQKAGQAVFIPAGCAHQVCNASDCIKIAIDFVSLENIERCWKVTDEFREQTRSETLWREDVLQLKSQLLWAWRSCERFDQVAKVL